MGRPNVVLDKIVNYLRDKNAFSNTDGVTFTTDSLAQICACTPPACTYNIRKLLNAKVLIIKKGIYGNGPKSWSSIFRSCRRI